MNPTFIRYEKNETPEAQRGPYEPMGIAVIGLFDNKVILRYTIKPGKEGKGFFITEFSQKLNGEWFKSHTIDSNVMKEEIENLIKKNISNYSKQVPEQKASFSQMSFKTEECPF